MRNTPQPTLDGFIQTTIQVLHEHGLDAYMPTIVPLGKSDKPLLCIHGIPDDVDHRDALQQVILAASLDKDEFFFCVRDSDDELVGGHYRKGQTDFFRIRRTALGFIPSPAASCPWWKMGPGWP